MNCNLTRTVILSEAKDLCIGSPSAMRRIFASVQNTANGTIAIEKML
jgi:hypothetical protein